MTDNIFGNMIDPENRLAYHQHLMTGVKHLYRREPLDPRPGEPISLILTTGATGSFDKARCFFTIDGSDPSTKQAEIIPLEPIETLWDPITWSYVRKWIATIPPQASHSVLRYRLEAHDRITNKWLSADTDPGKTAPVFALSLDDDPPPDWAYHARVYQIFPDRFYPGNGKPWNKPQNLTGFYGGTLRGVIDKLDYIHSLSFNTIWLNPFFTTSSHHGYNASDYYAVEPRLGTMADISELIDQAHARGIRLILDFVANHWSKDHFSFQEALKDQTSPYHDWYTWKQWPDEYECYFHVRELPKINLNHPQARKYMLEVAKFWLQKGFDGYRLDFAYGPPHDFWLDFRNACREVKHDCWIFGEIIHSVPMLLSYTGIMDGTLDFHLTRALRETFGMGNMRIEAFETFLSSHEKIFPREHIRPSFLDNHDEARFLFIAGNDKRKLRLAALIMYTLSGPPIVYCGTETGLSQERPMEQNGRNIFEETRLPMNWESADADLQETYRRLNRLREEHPVIIYGDRKVRIANDPDGVYAYTCEDRSDHILVVVNQSYETREISLELPGHKYKKDDLFNTPIVTTNDGLTIILPALSGALIV